MGLLPASPRSRRRLVRIAVVVVLLLAGAAIALLIPTKKAANPAPAGNEGLAQLAAAPKTHIPAAERRAIDSTLDRFIPAAVEGNDPAAAWALAGPELRSGSSLAAWRSGSSPVPAYPATGTTFHAWRTIDSGPRYVIFNILIHPRHGSKLAPYEFSGEMVKQNGRWLVNRLYTIAIFNRVTKTTHEIGPADFAAPAPSAPAPAAKPRLGKIGLLPIVGILALIVLIPLLLGGIALVRARRWRRQIRASARTEMPPLPRSLREPQESTTRH